MSKTTPVNTSDGTQETIQPTHAKELNLAVIHSLTSYLEKLDGEAPANLYDMVLDQIEKPLIKTVMQHCNDNQSKAAQYLGISRSTLRKKQAKLNL